MSMAALGQHEIGPRGFRSGVAPLDVTGELGAVVVIRAELWSHIQMRCSRGSPVDRASLGARNVAGPTDYLRKK